VHPFLIQDDSPVREGQFITPLVMPEKGVVTIFCHQDLFVDTVIPPLVLILRVAGYDIWINPSILSCILPLKVILLFAVGWLVPVVGPWVPLPVVGPWEPGVGVGLMAASGLIRVMPILLVSSFNLFGVIGAFVGWLVPVVGPWVPLPVVVGPWLPDPPEDVVGPWVPGVGVGVEVGFGVGLNVGQWLTGVGVGLNVGH
jgi:hypothetical protein